MSIKDTKKHLSNINKSLNDENINLKTVKDDLIDHIGTLLKRQKQLSSLKIHLSDELRKTQDLIKLQAINKQPECVILREEVTNLQSKLLENHNRIANLQNQYQLCLTDYDSILLIISEIIEKTKIHQYQIQKQKQSDTTMKAMIFDYEKLKRVLEEEKRYFKQLSNSEEYSHAERFQQLKKIRQKLMKDENNTDNSHNQSKIKLGYVRLNKLVNKKKFQDIEYFLRGILINQKKIELGIQILSNCFSLTHFKCLESQKKLFYNWYHKVFQKSNLANLVQNALINHQQSKIKLKIINQMTQKINSDGINLLNFYQKMKFIGIVCNSVSRKDKHYGFNRWRENCHQRKYLSMKINSVFNIIITKMSKRIYLKLWYNNVALVNRLQTAQQLLINFQNKRDLGRMMRRWRLQVSRYDFGKIEKYIDRLKMHSKIRNKIAYQKRKVRIITSLQLKMSHIQMRNYFYKYWRNCKLTMTTKLKQQIQEERQQFSQQRKQSKKNTLKFQNSNKIFSLAIFKKFIVKCKMNPLFKKWKNTSQFISKRNYLIFCIVLRRQGKNKLYVMNQMRKLVQYYEKKQMHQVLTDLNHKMQVINEKSSGFRQALKTCIENLGIVASKKMMYILNYGTIMQKKVLFDRDIRILIRKKYKMALLDRCVCILNFLYCKQAFKNIQLEAKSSFKNKILDIAQKKYYQTRNQKIIKKAFYAISKILHRHKGGFSRLIHIENVMIYYRMSCAIRAVSRKSYFQNFKSKDKQLKENQKQLQSKLQNQDNLIQNKTNLQKILAQLFSNFIKFEDRAQKIKFKREMQKKLKFYFTKFRKINQQFSYRYKVLNNWGGLVGDKNMEIFWKGLLMIKYEHIKKQVVQDLSKINKKRKNFDEKHKKIQGDIIKRNQQEENVHQQHLNTYSYYVKKYQTTLQKYQIKLQLSKQYSIKKSIFSVWKTQHQSVMTIYKITNIIVQRHFIQIPFYLMLSCLQNACSQQKSQMMCIQLLQKKGNQLIRDALSLWRYNIINLKCKEIETRVDGIDDYIEQINQGCKTNGELISREVLRVKRKKMLSNIFAEFKKEWSEQRGIQRKLQYYWAKKNIRTKKQNMVCWKWFTYFYKVSRNYLIQKKLLNQSKLKEDVFVSLKIYRNQHYNFINKSIAIIETQLIQLQRYSLDKIINVAANYRDQLDYKRKRILYSILKQKQTRIKIIKKKIIAKWNALLIPRFHYLPTIMKSIETKILRQSFAKINEHKYWHNIYVKQMADQVTTQGYNEVNNNTNSLIHEGFDPDEIKAYLKKRNNKDSQIIRKVTNHFRCWKNKQYMIRAFNSWLQYLFLKKKIKKAFTKVFNISDGLGRYWNRWKNKDAHFSSVLQKQSRVNMMLRYNELARLLKQYKRDIKDSEQYCDELKDINIEYEHKNYKAIQLAFSTLANSLKKGIRQGFQLWRTSIKDLSKQYRQNRYDELIQGIELMNQKKIQLNYRLAILKEQNTQYREKCFWGSQCGAILQKLLTEKDQLSIDLADKQHNMKLLLEDNLRLKLKVKHVKDNAEKLILKINQQPFQ